MMNKKFLLVMLVTVLAFAFLLTGCDLINSIGSCTFSFKVENNRPLFGDRITKIEFINGPNENDPVLRTETVNISKGETSGIYTVEGFTEESQGYDEYGTTKRNWFGVRVTYDNNETLFTSTGGENRQNFLIHFGPYNGIHLQVTEDAW